MHYRKAISYQMYGLMLFLGFSIAASSASASSMLFQDNFGTGGTLTDPSGRAAGPLADFVKYNITNTGTGQVAIAGGLLDWTGSTNADGEVTGNGTQNWTFRTTPGGTTNFNWAPYVASNSYEISFTYRTAWSHPLTFGLSDNPQAGNWEADIDANYDFAFGAYGANWQTGSDGVGSNHYVGAGLKNTEHDIVLKIKEPAGTAEVWVNGLLITTRSINFENSGRYFSFAEPGNYGGYMDNFTLSVIATTVYWDGGSGGWDTVANWSFSPGATTPNPFSVPSSNDVVTFNISTATAPQTVDLNGDQAAKGLTFSSSGKTTIVGGNTNRTLTLGADGITLQAGSGGAEIGSTVSNKVAVVLSASQVWLNNSASLLKLVGTLNGDLNLGVHQLTIDGSGNTTNDAVVQGSGGIDKAGSGTLTLSGASTYNGATSVNAGRLTLGNASALGGSSVTVSNGAQVYVSSRVTYTNPLTLSGNGLSLYEHGALRFNGGTTAVWAGPITLDGDARIGAFSGAGSYTLSGGIGGIGALEFWAGGAATSHYAIFTLSAPCSYSGDTLMNTYAASPSIVLAGGSNTLPTNTTVSMLAAPNYSATLKLNGNNQKLAGLTSGSGVFGGGGSNRVVNGSATLATLQLDCNTDKFFDGYLGGPGANENNFSFIKEGMATMRVNRSTTCSGLSVHAGTLDLAGGFQGGSSTVFNGATLMLGGGTNTMTNLDLQAGSTLVVNAGSLSNPDNTVIQVNGNLTLDGVLFVQDLGDAQAGDTLQIIQYTGSLSGSGLTVHPNSQWNISVTVDTGAQRVNIHLLERLPLIAFTTPDITVSNSLQLDMQGVLNGFPTTPVYYEVHTSDGRLRDFGAMPPDSNWNIKLRHLREGTNTVRVFTLGVGGVQEEDRRQVVLKLGANPRVRPRPWPTEIWWGGVATGLAPDYGFAQLVDPAKPWDFVKQYQDGFFLHGILPQPSTLAKLSDVLAPYTSRFGQEGGFYVPASTNAGIQAAAAHTANHLNLTAAGIYISFVSLDWNPRLKPWNTTPGWVETWPNWTHNQLLDNNMQCWDDLVTLLHDDWPGLKIGQTWSPVWFNWGGYPALIPSGDNLTLNPAKDVNGNVVTNASGNPVSHVFDMQEFFGKAVATAQTEDGYWGFSSDCPYDYFYGDIASPAARALNQQKILAYETWQRTNGYFATTLCNSSTENQSDPNEWDSQFMAKSFDYMVKKQQMGGRTQKYLFESWYSGPYTWAPESNTNSYSGTVKNAIRFIKGIADTSGTLEPLSLTLLASGQTNIVQLRNEGGVTCLPAVAGFGSVSACYDANGAEITDLVFSQEGYVHTNLLAPGQVTTIKVVTPGGASVTLEAFWNPQDPTGIVRDRLVLNPTNHPPMLTVVSNQTVVAGQTLMVSQGATDLDVPPQELTFSLLAPPPGATITTNGLFIWRPATAQSPSSNEIAVVVTDNGVPNLGATQTFWVVVNTPAQLSMQHGGVIAIGASNGLFNFTLTGDTGPDYTVEASTNLINWTSLLMTNSPTLPFVVSDPAVTNFPKRFYRIMLGP